MAVREDEGRRLGGGPEKLLTLEEAARRLGVPADDVEALIRSGKLPSFKLGGTLLRVRRSDVDALRPSPAKPPPARPAARTERSAKVRRSANDRWFDFLYFNDFYLIAALIILTLLALIFAL